MVRAVVPTLSVALAGQLGEALAQLVQQPQLHADERLPALLGELAPRLGSGQHVTHTALRQTQDLLGPEGNINN